MRCWVKKLLVSSGVKLPGTLHRFNVTIHFNSKKLKTRVKNEDGCAIAARICKASGMYLHSRDCYCSTFFFWFYCKIPFKYENIIRAVTKKCVGLKERRACESGNDWRQFEAGGMPIIAKGFLKENPIQSGRVDSIFLSWFLRYFLSRKSGIDKR